MTHPRGRELVWYRGLLVDDLDEEDLAKLRLPTIDATVEARALEVLFDVLDDYIVARETGALEQIVRRHNELYEASGAPRPPRSR